MGARPFILVIDEEGGVLGLLQEALSFEYDVCTVHNRCEAIGSLKTRRPDVILIGLGDTTSSGIELIDAIRSYPSDSNIPILVTCSVPFIKQLAPQVQAIVPKPFALRQLLNRVAELVQTNAVPV